MGGGRGNATRRETQSEADGAREVATYDTGGVEMIEAVENQQLTFCLGLQFHPEVAVAKVVSKSEDAGNYTDHDTSLTFFKAIIGAGRNRSHPES